MKLDDALREASEATDNSIRHVVADARPTAGSGGRAGVALASLAAATLAVLGVVVLGRGDSTATPTAADQPEASAQTTEPAEPMLLVTDGLTDTGFSPGFSGAVDDLGTPNFTLTRHAYGIAGEAPGDIRLVVAVHTGPLGPPVPGGKDIQLGDRPGVRMDDETIFVQVDDAHVVVYSSGLTIDQLDEIGATITADGQVDAPAGLSYLGAEELLYFDELNLGAHAGGQVSSYDESLSRHVNIASLPLVPNAEDFYRWGSRDDVEVATIGGRQVLIITAEDMDDFARIIWFEDGATVDVTTVGLTRAELEAVVAGVRPASEGPVAKPPAENAASEDVVPFDPDGRYVTSPPAGMELVASGDLAGLGTPAWVSHQFVYGTGSAPEPGAPALVLTLSPAPPGFFPGEAVDIGGNEAVIVDQEAAGTSTDLEMIIGDQGVELTGSDQISMDQIIEAAEAYVGFVPTSPDNVPTSLGPGLELQKSSSFNAFGDQLAGHPEERMAVYEDGDRRLSVRSLPLSATTYGIPAWLFAETIEGVQIGEVEGVLVERDNFASLRFRHEGRIVEVVANGLSRDELIAAAQGVREATADEWDVGNS